MITKIMEYKEVRIGNSRVVIAPAINASDIREVNKVFDSMGLRRFSREEAEKAISLCPRLKEELRGTHFDTSDGEGLFVDENRSVIFKAVVRTDLPFPKR
jgi:hypothetical protein